MKERDLLTQDAVDINAEIVGALNAALDSYKKERLDVTFAKHIKLDSDLFGVGLSHYKSSYIKGGAEYRLTIRFKGYKKFIDLESRFNDDRYSKDYYAVVFDCTLQTKSFMGKDNDWRKDLQGWIKPFDKSEEYAQQKDIESIRYQIEMLDAKVKDINRQAVSMLENMPHPVKYVPADLCKLYPALFFSGR